MGVFHVFQIVHTVLNRATHHINLSPFFKQKNKTSGRKTLKENSPFSCNKRKTKQHWSKKQASERLFGTYKNFPWKLTFQPLICKCSYPYQVTRNVSFSEDFAYIQIRSCLTFLVELFPSFFYFLDIQIKILQQIYH